MIPDSLIKNLRSAWDVAGPCPAYHLKQKSNLYFRWKTLYDAVLAIVRHTDKTYENDCLYTLEVCDGISKGPVEIFEHQRSSFIRGYMDNFLLFDNYMTAFSLKITVEK